MTSTSPASISSVPSSASSSRQHVRTRIAQPVYRDQSGLSTPSGTGQIGHRDAVIRDFQSLTYPLRFARPASSGRHSISTLYRVMLIIPSPDSTTGDSPTVTSSASERMVDFHVYFQKINMDQISARYMLLDLAREHGVFFPSTSIVANWSFRQRAAHGAAA